jgi:hypothetical protein
VKKISILMITLQSVCSFAIFNGFTDYQNTSVVRLISKEKNAHCSGTVVGTNPVTVVTALHCVLASPEGFYLDTRPLDTNSSLTQNELLFPPLVGTLISSPIKTSSISGKLNLSENFNDQLLSTKIIIPPEVKQSLEYTAYHKRLNEKSEKLTQIVNQIFSKLVESQSGSGTLNPFSLKLMQELNQPQKLSERDENEEEVVSEEELQFIISEIQKLGDQILGLDFTQNQAKDAAVLVFENIMPESESVEDLIKQKKLMPIVIGAPEKIDEEIYLTGFGVNNFIKSALDYNESNSTVRKTTKNKIVNQEHGFMVIHGLDHDISNSQFPKGNMGIFNGGDSGGALILRNSLLGVISFYNTNKVYTDGEYLPGWPQYIKSQNKSFYKKGYVVRLDAPIFNNLWTEAISKGAQLTFQDFNSGNIYVREQNGPINRE